MLLPKWVKVVRKAAELTADRDCIGAAKLVVFCNARKITHLWQAHFMVLENRTALLMLAFPVRGVVRAAVAQAGDCDITEIANIVKKNCI